MCRADRDDRRSQDVNAPTIAPKEVRSSHCCVIYDANNIATPDDTFFDSGYWRRKNALIDASTGRGTAFAFRSGEEAYVLRHYRRGGQAQKLSRDRYLWTGLARTRAWREWHLLADMWREGLPVPRPVAARVERGSLGYRADIVTQHIPHARTLIDAVRDSGLTRHQWRAVGACIRRFHDAGVYHADLNARNILIDTHDQIFLIDFDRGKRRAPHRAWQRANLQRLKRSLEKYARDPAASNYLADDFTALLDGYDAGRTT